MLEEAARFAELCDGKAEPLILRLAFYVRDTALAFIRAKSHDVQSSKI